VQDIWEHLDTCSNRSAQIGALSIHSYLCAVGR